MMGELNLFLINLKTEHPVHVSSTMQKAKGLEIYFSCNHCIMLAYFYQFRNSDKLLRKFVLVTIFEHMVVNFKHLLLERNICWKPILWLSPSFVMLHIEKKIETVLHVYAEM